MNAIVFGFPGHDSLTQAIAHAVGGDTGALVLHRFPDNESYVRLGADVSGREVVLVCGLHDPDAKALPLVFAADAARELGARRVGVVAPYLGYMRQDARFQPGEAITSASFGRVLSASLDWIVTIDPHLHRHPTLAAVYSIAGVVVHAAPLIARWIRDNVASPLLVGPDQESAQWVGEVAAGAGAPYVVLEKTRRGDREVEVSVPRLERWADRTPVLVDDIISTARTMSAAVARLRSTAARPPVCVGVHAVFAGDAYESLQRAGATQVVTCNTIPHASNNIDVNPLIAARVRALLVEG